MIELLNHYSNAAIAVLTLFLVLTTIGYTVFTLRIVTEMQMTRAAELRPYINISTFGIGQMFYLTIKNSGKTAAQNVRFKLDRNIENIWKNKIDEMPLFKEGISFFPPDKEYVIVLGASRLFFSPEKDTEKYPSTFSITSEYSFLTAKKTTETTVVNLNEYLHTQPRPNELVATIKEYNEKIEKALKGISINSAYLDPKSKKPVK